MVKPFKGNLYHWRKIYFDMKEIGERYKEDPGLGYVIHGHLDPVPRFGNWWRTSWVVKHDIDGNIETRNSHYTLIGDEIEPVPGTNQPY